MPENNKEKIVKQISKGDTEKVFVSLRNYRGKTLLDLRQYYQNDKNEWLPTKKGVSLNAEHFDELKEGILLLEKELEDF